jgi:hypothetical protein
MKKGIVIVFLFFVFASGWAQETLVSNKGTCMFQNQQYMIQITLTDNYKKVLSDWDNPKPGFIPGVEPVLKYKKTGNLVPFISYIILDKSRIKTKLFYNISMVKADGKTSANSANGMKIKTWDAEFTKLYRTEDLYGWQFEKTDPSGEYKIFMEVFDNEGFSQKFEMTFILE